jgi:hypothetical protein
MKTFFVTLDERQLIKKYENILNQMLFFCRRAKMSVEDFYNLTIEERNYLYNVLIEEVNSEQKEAEKLKVQYANRK